MTRLAGTALATAAAVALAAGPVTMQAAGGDARPGVAYGARSGAAYAGSAIIEVHFAMGTPVAITARGDDEIRTRAAIRAGFREIRRLEAILTAWQPDSATSRLNRTAGGAPAQIPPELAAVLAAASRLARQTDEAFSVLVGPIVAAWRASDPRQPSPAALAAATALARGNGLLRDGDHAALREPGMRLDLDGIAKGFAADRVVALLRARGVPAAIVNLGGSSMAAYGDAADGAPGWPVEIPPTRSAAAITSTTVAPGEQRSNAAAHAARSATANDAAAFRLVDQALSASTSRARDADADDEPARGRIIVDPRTGDRITRDATAIVVHPSATDAEAWSKALLVRGWTASEELARHGGQAILQDGADGPRCTPRFRNVPGVCKVLRPAAASSARPRTGQEMPSG